jgi:hypothetical protein
MAEERARPKWAWLPGAKRYYSYETHRFVSFAQVDEWAQETLRVSTAATTTLAEMVADHRLNVADWQRQMKQVIKAEYIAKYTAGRGGIEAMTQSDWGRLGAIIKEQYGYLRGFAQAITDGTLSEAQIKARAAMYVRSGREAFMRAQARALDAPDLPAYPGDGTTDCLTNCQCRWIIREYRDRWECTWALGIAEHCDTCVGRAQEWAPLIIPKEGTETKDLVIDRGTGYGEVIRTFMIG